MKRTERPSQPQSISHGRRSFLGASLAAPAVVVAAPALPGHESPEQTSDDAARRGYHLTERIRTYYRLARF